MASTLFLTRPALLHLTLAPAPEAAVIAVAPLFQSAVVAVVGDATGHRLQHLHLVAGHPIIPGPAHILVATEVPPVVAVKTILDMAVDTTAATGPALPPTALHRLQIGTRVADTAGPAPGLPTNRTGTGGR